MPTMHGTSKSGSNLADSKNIPNYGESKRCIDMHEKRSDLVLVMEYKTVPPCDDCAGK